MCAEVIWMGGAYGSHRMKILCEDQVFEYDVPTLEECQVLVVNCNTCAGYMEHVTMTHLTLSLVLSIMQ